MADPDAGLRAAQAGLIDALERRAQASEGAAREAIERRLAAWRTRAAAENRGPPAADAAPARAPSPLSGLTQALRERRLAARPPPARSGAAPAIAPSPGEALLHELRRDWARANAHERLRESRARAPRQAGPLNSHRLVLRALAQLQDVAPAYLEGLVNQVESLWWLERALDDVPAATEAPATPRPRRTKGRTAK